MEWWQIILRILSLLGALALFLFGMKTLSEALQRIAGGRARKVLSQLTSRRFNGLMSGFLVTGIAQSSSAITVMIVTFVNAGLISLTESAALIMGANVGTTITAWLVSLFGFAFHIQQFYLPIIGLSLILFMSIKPRRRSWGEFIFGIGLLFIGLELLKVNVPDLNQYPETLDFLANYTSMGYLSVILFILTGVIITIIIQSSSASITLFLVVCYNGSISFEHAAAMVMGANIGTTITANLAAIVTNQTAKRSARIHFLFNFIGTLLFLALFNPLMQLTDHVISRFSGLSILQHESSELPQLQAILPIALSAFHSFFNLTNALIQINFLPLLVKLSGYLVMKREGKKETFTLQYISSRLSSTSEISIVQVRKELVIYGKKIQQMFHYIPELLMEKKDARYEKLLKKITKAKAKTNQMEAEISAYLTRLVEDEISVETSRRIRSMLMIAREMEQIGDRCYGMALSVKTKNEHKVWFTQEMRDNLFLLFELVQRSLALMLQNLEKEPKAINMQGILALEDQMDQCYSRIHHQHLSDIMENKYSYVAGTFYADMLSSSVAIGNHALKVSQLLTGNH